MIYGCVFGLCSLRGGQHGGWWMSMSVYYILWFLPTVQKKCMFVCMCVCLCVLRWIGDPPGVFPTITPRESSTTVDTCKIKDRWIDSSTH